MTKAEKRHLNAVADLGCILCAVLGTPGTPAEIHHLRDGQGMGQRSSHFDAIGLCAYHHRGDEGYHGMGKRRFEAVYGVTERQLLSNVRRLLNV